MKTDLEKQVESLNASILNVSRAAAKEIQKFAKTIDEQKQFLLRLDFTKLSKSEEDDANEALAKVDNALADLYNKQREHYIIDVAPKERLQINNLLRDKLSEEILSVAAISDTGITLDLIDKRKFPLPTGWQAERIPLTGAWLIRFNFTMERKFGGTQWNREDLFITESKNNFFVVIGIKRVLLNYVDELQNLYLFAMNRDILL